MRKDCILEKFKDARDNTFYAETKRSVFRSKGRWHFCPIWISFKYGLLFLFCVYNKSDYSKDQALIQIEFRKRYAYVQRTSLSIFGITIIEEEFKIERGSNESES